MPGRTVNNIGGGAAARKRSRRDANEDGDEEVVDVREASSGLHSEDVCMILFLNSQSELILPNVPGLIF